MSNLIRFKISHMRLGRENENLYRRFYSGRGGKEKPAGGPAALINCRPELVVFASRGVS
jgi:hypothetical protein